MSDVVTESPGSPPLPARQDGVPVGEAAKRLGLSTAATRKRIQRGTIEAYKGDDGLWYVVLDEDNLVSPDDPVVQDAGLVVVVDTLRDEVQFLRKELERRTDELRAERESRAEAERRRDILFAQFGDQLKSISQTTTTVQEQVEAVAHEVVPNGETVDSPPGSPMSSPVSWWRRILLGQS
jgi:hypothetical protein